ncbi:hypothetical protein ACFYPH_12540 [Micromonospora sp. NPDC005252]|uniref:hypothetical protein n=1 Tax=Micromonospora sp. NPDC005252 TaxID=3364228 RepID=UPI0036C36D7F
MAYPEQLDEGIAPKKATDLTVSMHVSTRKGTQRSRPLCEMVRAAGRRSRFRYSRNPMSTAGGMKSAVAPTPTAISAGVASTGARKNPTLPPAAKILIAVALSPAAIRADFPAAGWNIATPSPDTHSRSQTAT